MKETVIVRNSLINAETKIVVLLVLLCAVLSAVNLAFYRQTLLPDWDYLTDFHRRLLGHRLLVAILLLAIGVGIWVAKAWGRGIAGVSTLMLLGAYVYWYFEKFRWLYVIGAYEGSSEYSEKLKEIGYFRGANEIDYIVLFLIIAVFFWLLLRYQIKTRETADLT